MYNSSIIGVNIGKDYKSTIRPQQDLGLKEWSEFSEESGGWQVNVSFLEK